MGLSIKGGLMMVNAIYLRCSGRFGSMSFTWEMTRNVVYNDLRFMMANDG